ncbi:hypothetical protein QYE76_035383 [Lolium multiflorum]|uniref:Retrotransposon gag domain-containing protein n=1 Tax=Lolium multiflorum TaxID=4521 RepID=A0AAD8R0C3_LOLMU|nr:hypothetical protein QYE76_035383 [Lolium multiflorum]
MDRGKQIAAGLVDFVPHPPSRLDAYAYLVEPMEMTFGRFHFRVEKEGSYRVEIPISSGSSAVDSDFSSYASSTESEEETSATRYVSTRAREELAKIFSDMSFESSADSYISDGSSDVDSYDFIDKSITVGKELELWGQHLYQRLPKERQGKIVHDLQQQRRQHLKDQVEQGTQQHKQGSTERGKAEGIIGNLQNLTTRICAAYHASRGESEKLESPFKLPDNFKKFDGLQDPEDWLVDYLETVKLTGGTRATAMQSIQVHLSGAARSWIKKLTPGSIDSWESFEDVFVKNFRSTCKKPASLEELRACRQKPDEPMRKYIQRWNIIKNSA